jgi:hypothetical protein
LLEDTKGEKSDLHWGKSRRYLQENCLSQFERGQCSCFSLPEKLNGDNKVSDKDEGKEWEEDVWEEDCEQGTMASTDIINTEPLMVSCLHDLIKASPVPHE